MIIRTISQPPVQLGREIQTLLEADVTYTRIVFVSAFVALRTILRFRDLLLHHAQNNTNLRFTIGIDLGGTSLEVLRELVTWDCEKFIFHNRNSRSTFHPKIYLFETNESATLFVGSNNLTDGGFYTNYEATTRYDFQLPQDSVDYANLISPFSNFINPTGVTVRALDEGLIDLLTARGELLPEVEARRRRGRALARPRTQDIPMSPFQAESVELPPLLPTQIRAQDVVLPLTPEVLVVEQIAESPIPTPVEPAELGSLVWSKVLSNSDALQVSEGTAPVGGVRLTQARFESPPGQRIDQTSYFRNLFSDYHWEQEIGRNRGATQEHAFVPMRLIIRGMDYGIHNFEISHKPSGEAGQNNYTTILRWGRVFNPIIEQLNLANETLWLYETYDDNGADFTIKIGTRLRLNLRRELS